MKITFMETQKTVKKTQKIIYYLNSEKNNENIFFIVLKKNGF